MARHRARRLSFRLRRRTPRACRNRHAYGPGQQIGAGIVRHVCSACGAVSIDLTRADEAVTVGSLFEASDGTLLRT
ncbi:MAG: hypothetical protein R3246_02045 [Acidimicrobiia bacterium]|nr:hypothetical protein [Acidimicrobiia bacterium]